MIVRVTFILSILSTSTFSAISSSLWHDRLGHPGAPVLKALRVNKSIDWNRTSNSSISRSCVFGKHITLSVVSCTSSTSLPFDIIHSDIWTSPVLSSAGHSYYVLLLDDFSKFLWTFPLGQKSKVYEKFMIFKAHVVT